MMFNYSSIADENSSHGDDCALLDLMMMIVSRMMIMIMMVLIITSWVVIISLWVMIKKMIMMTIITSWVVHFSSIVLLHGHSDGPAEPEHHVNFKPDNHDHPNLTKVILELWERFWLFLSSIATSSEIAGHILLLRQTTN